MAIADLSPMKYEHVRVGALTFDVLTAGPADGTPVMLLHGFPQNADGWAQQVPALAAAGYRVIAPNQRGYSAGARPADVAAYGTADVARDALGIADALGAKRFHLVGHDWGATVAWAVAAVVPGRLFSVTAISVPHIDAFAEAMADPKSSQRDASSYIAQMISPDAEEKLLANDSAMLRALYEGLPAPRVDAYARFFDAPTLTGGLSWYRASLAAPAVGSAMSPPRGALGPVTVPALYVWSDGDAAICRDAAERTRKFVTGPYRFEVLDGANHWIPELVPERLNPLLLAHLAEHGPAGGGQRSAEVAR